MTEKLTQKWAIASFFDELEVGYEFDSSDTPLHTTLAGVFDISIDGSGLADLIEEELKGTGVFSVVGSDKEEWGSVKVTTLEPSMEIRSLIDAVQRRLLAEGGVFNEPQFLGQGFTPHVTVQKTSALEVGEKVAVASVSLVDMLPSDDGQRRRVAANFHLWQHRH